MAESRRNRCINGFGSWVLIFFAVGIVAAALSQPNSSTPNLDAGGNGPAPTLDAGKPSPTPTPSVYDGECGISASGEIGPNIINYPELRIDIRNDTDKEIAAIKFHIVSYDVYGEKLTGPLVQEGLYTDSSIGAGASTSISYQLLERKTYDVDLYVYSVYFADGTEWGNREALKSEILKHAVQIEVEVNS